MNDYPIIFSAPMVAALLGGRKTQTRRGLYRLRNAKDETHPAIEGVVQRINPATGLKETCWPGSERLRPLRSEVAPEEYWSLSPWHKLAPGDRLWVRENWRPDDGDPKRTIYMADQAIPRENKWRSSLHLSRARSRLTLQVTATKIERLQDISEADALAEGAMYHDGRDTGHSGWRHDYRDVYKSARSSFLNSLWPLLHGAGSVADNPWVICIDFSVQHRNIDRMEQAA